MSNTTLCLWRGMVFCCLFTRNIAGRTCQSCCINSILQIRLMGIHTS